MPKIEVITVEVGRLLSRFQVRVTDEDGSATEHDVTLSVADHERLGGGYPRHEAFVRACFDFLLERESKESKLRSFDISQIAHYFHEFDREIVCRGG
jgi:hypothetical protein